MTKYSLDDVIGAVAAYYGVPEKVLLGRARPDHVVVARQMAMYIARHTLGYSLPKVAEAMNRNHATVLYAVRKFEFYMTSKERSDYNKILHTMTFIKNTNPYFTQFAMIGKGYLETLKGDFVWELKQMGKHPRCFDVIYTEV